MSGNISLKAALTSYFISLTSSFSEDFFFWPKTPGGGCDLIVVFALGTFDFWIR
jgi:hypothetical protein